MNHLWPWRPSFQCHFGRVSPVITGQLPPLPSSVSCNHHPVTTWSRRPANVRPAPVGTSDCPSNYNQLAVSPYLSSRSRRILRLAGSAVFLFCAALVAQGPPSQAPSPAEAAAATAGKDRILLVLPFENRTGQPSLEWIREAAPALLSARFTSAGFAPMSRADRLYALDHLGLPQGWQPSHASSLKLAQTLDADSIVVGNYITDGSRLIAEGRIVDVPRMRMSPPVTARGDMKDLVRVFDSLAWKLTRQLDPTFSVAEETFV